MELLEAIAPAEALEYPPVLGRPVMEMEDELDGSVTVVRIVMGLVTTIVVVLLLDGAGEVLFDDTAETAAVLEFIEVV